MSNFLTKYKDKYIALRGFHTNRHLLLIESDDWGSIRMPSKEVFLQLQRMGDCPEKDAFLRNDCLENEADLLALFEVLTSVVGKNESPAVMTANFAMANPDFDRIDWENGIYYYEPFYKSYHKYYPSQDILACVKSGIGKGCFVPQLHCREHMNVNRWMTDLKTEKNDTKIAFQNHMIGIYDSFSKENPFGYMDAFNSNFSSNEELANILTDAMNIFENTFDKKSDTFVASCFVWNRKIEETLYKLGVKGIQSGCWQNIPHGTKGNNALKRRIHFTGQKNKFGQIYSVRNCSYEPSYLQNPRESAEHCLSQVLNSFENRKPAVINSHRFNYIGSINSDNASKNLESLRWLLNEIKSRVPDVEFISSEELIKTMSTALTEK